MIDSPTKALEVKQYLVKATSEARQGGCGLAFTRHSLTSRVNPRSCNSIASGWAMQVGGVIKG